MPLGSEMFEKCRDPVGASENYRFIGSYFKCGVLGGGEIVGWFDCDGGDAERFRADFPKLLGKGGGLFYGSRDQDALSEERMRVEPADALPFGHHPVHD